MVCFLERKKRSPDDAQSLRAPGVLKTLFLKGNLLPDCLDFCSRNCKQFRALPMAIYPIPDWAQCYCFSSENFTKISPKSPLFLACECGVNALRIWGYCTPRNLSPQRSEVAQKSALDWRVLGLSIPDWWPGHETEPRRQLGVTQREVLSLSRGAGW